VAPPGQRDDHAGDHPGDHRDHEQDDDDALPEAVFGAGRDLGGFGVEAASAGPVAGPVAFGPRAAGRLREFTTGNNDVSEIGTGYDAAKNWDAVTGLGSPNASKLLPLLGVFTLVS